MNHTLFFLGPFLVFFTRGITAPDAACPQVSSSLVQVITKRTKSHIVLKESIHGDEETDPSERRIAMSDAAKSAAQPPPPTSPHGKVKMIQSGASEHDSGLKHAAKTALQPQIDAVAHAAVASGNNTTAHLDSLNLSSFSAAMFGSSDYLAFVHALGARHLQKGSADVATVMLVVALIAILMFVSWCSVMLFQWEVRQAETEGRLLSADALTAPPMTCKGKADSKAHSGFSPAVSGASMPPSPRAVLTQMKKEETVTRHLQRNTTPNSSKTLTNLCPDLLVPDGSECQLVVPRILLPGSIISASAKEDRTQIVDARGVPVFETKICNSPRDALSELQMRLTSEGGVTRESRQVYLSSSKGGDVLFAYGRVYSNVKSRKVVLYQASGAPFGEITAKDAWGFVVAVRDGARIYIRGDKDLGNVTITDSNARLMAIGEPLPEDPMSRGVRVGPHVDAGFIVLSLLGLDMLKYEEQHSRP